MDNKTKEDNIKESKETIKNKKHDQGYKKTFKNKDNMIDFLNSFIKEDWVKKEDLVLIDKEFILSNFIDKKKNLLRWIKNVIVENTSLDNKEKLIELIDETIETQEVDMMISNMGRVINEGLEAKLAEGIMKGIAKGEKIGSEKKSIITAIEMLKDNMNIELVAKYSKLKISKVKDIKNNLEEYKQVYLDKEKNINLDKE